MAYYNVQKIENQPPKQDGWYVFNSEGTQISGPWPTKGDAEYHANALELARTNILQLAENREFEAKAGVDCHSYSGKLLGMNEQFILVDAGPVRAHYFPRSAFENRGFLFEIDKIIEFRLANGAAISTKKAAPIRSRGISL